MTLAERVVVALVAVLLAIALMLVSTSCSHPAQRPVIEFYSQPKAPTPFCYVDAPPVAPELREINSDNQNVIDRVMIHRLDYAEAIAFMHDIEIWGQQVRECLGKLTE